MSTQSNTKGIFWMVVSTFFGSIMMGLVRYISHDMHPFQIVFFRNVFGLLFFLPLIYHVGFGTLKTHQFPLHIKRAVIGLIAMTMWFVSLANVPIAMATAVSFAAPIFAIIFAILFLGEKSDSKKWIALFIGFIGVMIVIRPSTEDFNPYALLILASAFLWGYVVVIIKKLTKIDSPLAVAVYMVLLMTPFSFPAALYVWEPVSLEQLLWLIALGLTSNVMQLSMAKAFSVGDVTVIQPFDFARLIFTAIIGYFAFGEILDGWTIAGSAVILCSLLYTTHHVVSNNRRIKLENEKSSEIIT